MIIWKDFILDPTWGATLTDENFEGKTHGLNLMEEGRVANQETGQTQSTAILNTGCVQSALSGEGLSLKTAAIGMDASAIARLSLRDTGRRGSAEIISVPPPAVEK